MLREKPSDPISIIGKVYPELLQDIQEIPWMPLEVCDIFGNIMSHPHLTKSFAIEWLKAIASIFEEQNIKDIIYKEGPLDTEMLNLKINDAKKRLSKAMTFKTEIDSKNYDIDYENNKILNLFEKWVIQEVSRVRLSTDIIKRNNKN
jgi:hypothetical protein